MMLLSLTRCRLPSLSPPPPHTPLSHSTQTYRPECSLSAAPPTLCHTVFPSLCPAAIPPISAFSPPPSVPSTQLFSLAVRVAPPPHTHTQHFSSTHASPPIPPPHTRICAAGMAAETKPSQQQQEQPNDARPPQIVVRKQGMYERGRWSTRILTIDVDAGTATISRKSKPQDVLYRSLHVQKVEMWPHYSPYAIESSYDSLKAKMVLCITGTEVSLTNHGSSVGSFLRSNIGPLISASVVAENASWSAKPSKHVRLKGIFAKRNPMFATMASNSAATDRSTLTWLIHCTSIESYELAVMLFMRFKNEGGARRKVFSNNVVADLACVKRAWIKHAARFKTATDAETS